MNNRQRWVSSALMLVAAVLLFGGFAVAGEIDAGLSDKLASIDESEFVRVIISMEEQPFVAREMGAAATKFVLREAAERTQAPVLQFLEARADAGAVKAFNSFWIVNVAFAEIRADQVVTLAALPGVARVFEDLEVTATPFDMVPADVGADLLRWEHVAAVFAPEVWEMGYQGQGISVAVVDTGVDITHPELAGAMGGEAPFHEGYWAEFDATGAQVPGSMPHDTDGHGTHVSGSVAGRNLEYQIGVAPQVTLAHGLIIPGGSGSFAQVLGGFQWAADEGFDIINGSLGINDMVPEMAVATDNLYAAGVVPIFSNGNIRDDGTVPPGAPGNTPSAIAIGGYDSDGTEAGYNRGDIIEYPGYEYDEFTRIKPDLSAPGVDILSAYPGGWAWAQGTSMAAPHAAGVVALMMSANPDLTIDEIKDALFTTTGGHAGHPDWGWADIPTKDIHFGWGRINALRAVEAVLPEVEGVPVIGGVFSDDMALVGATVTFSGPVTQVFTTDENGEFAGEIEEGHYTVTASKTGYLPKSREKTFVNTGETHESYFMLERAPLGAVVGTITDAQSGEPVGDVSVNVLETDVKTKTAEDGTYSFDLPEGVFDLSFMKSGFFPAEADGVRVVPEQTTQIDATVEFGYRTLAGEVTDDEQQSLSGATVTIAETGDETTTDAGGNFTFDLGPGTYTLQVTRSGYVAASASVTVEYGAVSEADVTMMRSVGSLQGTVRGAVIDAIDEAEPLADAVVSIPSLDLTTTTDEGGAYAFDVLPTGSHRVVVEHPEHYAQEATAHIELDETTTINFVLQNLGLQHTFRNFFDTEEERSEWSFIDYSGMGGWNFTTYRSFSESFSAWNGSESLISGWYPENQAAGIVSPDIEVPETEATLKFRLWAEIWGPFHAFGVFVVDTETDEEDLLYVWNESVASDGWIPVELSLDAYKGRTITIEFYVESDLLVLAGDEGVFIDNVIVESMDVETTSTIEGTVTSTDGTPVAGAHVTVLELNAAGDIRRTSQSTTGPDGTYELRVAAGGWTVRASSRPDFIDAEEFVSTAPGVASSVDFTLEANTPPASVTGLNALAGDGIVTLGWEAVAEDDLLGYNVYRSLDGENFSRIGFAEGTDFTVEELQNGFTYYFRVVAVDEYGLEGEAAEASATPTAMGPEVSVFDIKPRSLLRGGSLAVSAEFGHSDGDEAALSARVQALLGDAVIREWTFDDVSVGSFTRVLETKDQFGTPWAPNIYTLTLQLADEDGRVAESNPVNVVLLSPLPQSLSFLLGNNPFNPQTESQMMEYTVPMDGHVQVSVHTLDGRRVNTLVDEHKAAGQYVAFWDGTDSSGDMVLSGMYVVKVQFVDAAGEVTDVTRHSVVVK